MTEWKIRNKDRKFSTGGRYPSWTEKGKSWRNLKDVCSSIKLFEEYCKDSPNDVFKNQYKDVDIVEVRLVVEKIFTREFLNKKYKSINKIL